MSDWKAVKLPAGCKLLKVHNFTCMHGGNTYSIEVDEFPEGTFTGHGEQTTDSSNVIESVTADSLEACLSGLVSRIESRGS